MQKTFRIKQQASSPFGLSHFWHAGCFILRAKYSLAQISLYIFYCFVIYDWSLFSILFSTDVLPAWLLPMSSQGWYFCQRHPWINCKKKNKKLSLDVYLLFYSSEDYICHRSACHCFIQFLSNLLPSSSILPQCKHNLIRQAGSEQEGAIRVVYQNHLWQD